MELALTVTAVVVCLIVIRYLLKTAKKAASIEKTRKMKDAYFEAEKRKDDAYKKLAEYKDTTPLSSVIKQLSVLDKEGVYTLIIDFREAAFYDIYCRRGIFVAVRDNKLALKILNGYGQNSLEYIPIQLIRSIYIEGGNIEEKLFKKYGINWKNN